MRIGTPGFVAARLTEGREARGLTQTALAELTGIKPQSISHYEQGRQSPSPEALALLSGSLNLPERFFLRPPATLRSEPGFFHQPSSHPRNSSRLARLQAERHLTWAGDIVCYLRQYVEFPAVRIPRIATASEADIEKAADAVRQSLSSGTGPLDNLFSQLENAGCIVTHCAWGSSEVQQSYSQWDRDVPFIAVSAGGASCVRYAAARELGHLVLHSGHSAPEGTEAQRTIETQADRFARAFLLPARAFAADVWAPTINALLTLKRDWRCPISAMVIRCGELGIFGPDQLRRAAAGLVRRGWKSAEPREEDAAPETARFLNRSIQLLIDERLKDRHSLLSDLALNATDVEEICGLPNGFFTGGHAHSQTLRLRRDDEAGSASELLRVDAPDVMIA